VKVDDALNPRQIHTRIDDMGGELLYRPRFLAA
jgi:hypothetical protein